MKLQNNFTTIEQSKRLLELGVPANSADCYYDSWGQIQWRQLNDLDHDFFQKYNWYTPCWSVGRLIEIFCICTDDRWSIEYLNGMPQTIIEKTIEAINGNNVDFSKLEE